jgi:Secretion system C-terminal sorting domain
MFSSRKFIILIAVLLFSMVEFGSTTAQTLTTADILGTEMKYWKLRARLRGDENNAEIYPGMMRVGPNQGMGFVPVQRSNNMGTDDNYEWWPVLDKFEGISGTKYELPGPCFQQFKSTAHHSVTNAKQDPREPTGGTLEGILDFTENPLIHVGQYMSVLATEHALLSRQGAETKQVVQEIWHTLDLIDRIDLGLEPTYGYMAQLNGCIMRDDIAEDFAIQLMDKKADLVWSNFSCPKEYEVNLLGNNEVFSWFHDKSCDGTIRSFMNFACLNAGLAGPMCKKPKRIKVNIASGDEIGGLLQGLYFYKHFLPSNTVYNNQNIVDRTVAITDRLMQWLTNTHSTDPLWLFHKSHPWIMQDPDGEPVCKGPVVGNISYSYAKVAEKITGNSYTNGGVPYTFGWLINYLLANYLRANPTLNSSTSWIITTVPSSVLAGSSLWAPKISFASKLSHLQNFSMYARMNSITGQFNSLCAPPSGLLNIGQQAFYIADFKGKYTLGIPAVTNDWAIHDLIGSYFNHYKPLKDVYWWRDELNKLDCNGSCWQLKNNQNFADCSYYQDDETTLKYPPWNSNDRWNTSLTEPSLLTKGYGNSPWGPDQYGGKIKDATTNIGAQEHNAVFSGLDYMLAYNMWKIKFFTYGFRDKIRRRYVETLPLNMAGTIIGGASIPRVVKAVYSLDATDSKLGSTAVAKFTAGSSCFMGPGFKSEKGSILTAQIKKYDCAPTFKNGVGQGKKQDSTYLGDFLDFEDSLVVEDYSDSLDGLSDIDQAELDTALYYFKAYVITYPNDSTVEVRLHPDWQYDSVGNLIYKPNSTPRHMQPATSLSSALVYPNPAKAFINIKYFVPKNAKHSSTLYSISGQYLQVLNTNNFSADFNTTTYDISQLAKGFYILRLEVDGIKQDYKFVKE